MEPRRDAPGTPLDLRCDAVAPWLWRVSWRHDAPASESEREELARVARSRESGALIVLVPEEGAPARLPEALLPLTGSAVPAFELAALPPADECGALRCFAPRGRGRVVLASGRLIEPLKPKAAMARAQAHLERAIADFALRDGWRPLPARRAAIDAGELLAAAATARDFDHATGCDENFVEMAGRGAAARPIAARLVRGTESFTLRLQAGGRPLGQKQLVLVRATAPADRGALLRVELDDEDLGPWRLGDLQPQECVSFDLFRISSDLLAGRQRMRLAFRLEGRTEAASLRWWFLTEEEPDGLWLTELEPAHAHSISADRTAGGALLAHDDELFLRGLELAPRAEVRYVLPRGERRLAALVAPVRAPEQDATLSVTANGSTTRVTLPAGSGARRELARSVAGDELGIVNESDVALLLLSPQLLR